MIIRKRFKAALVDVDHVLEQGPENFEGLQLRSFCRMTLGLRLDDSLLDAELSAIEQLLEKEPKDAWHRGIHGPCSPARETSSAPSASCPMRLSAGTTGSNSNIIAVSHDFE